MRDAHDRDQDNERVIPVFPKPRQAPDDRPAKPLGGNRPVQRDRRAQ
ncbi:hypothetical protein [Streptomyces sp. NPDC097619]